MSPPKIKTNKAVSTAKITIACFRASTARFVLINRALLLFEQITSRLGHARPATA
jgi:hypothetical protein